MEELVPGVWTHAIDAQGFATISTVVFTERHAFVVDTLTRPQDMQATLDLLEAHARGRRITVVSTHHHWDHVYGNAAFPHADIIAHRACSRLITAQAASADESIPLAPPEGVPLPNIVFGDRLTFHDPGQTVHLIHTPGHSEDSIVVFLADARVLLGGDTVEWPLPSFAQRDGRRAWVQTLRQLKQLPVDLIVPSHGPAMGKEIIDANEHYLTSVYDAVADAKDGPVGRNDLDLPVESFVDAGVDVDDVHAAVHRENLIWAWDEV